MHQESTKQYFTPMAIGSCAIRHQVVSLFCEYSSYIISAWIMAMVGMLAMLNLVEISYE